MAERYNSPSGRVPPPVGEIVNRPPARRYAPEAPRTPPARRYEPTRNPPEPSMPRLEEFGHVEETEAEVLRELGDQERGGAVEITYFPTKTSNPRDPRTAAAGYDRTTQTLRVEWGDGGVAYNYYGVPPNIWRNFRRAPSPGKYINRVLNYYQYGKADED